MRISDWSSDVCSSDLGRHEHRDSLIRKPARHPGPRKFLYDDARLENVRLRSIAAILLRDRSRGIPMLDQQLLPVDRLGRRRSEEHTSELQSLMRISYAVFCLKKKT